MQPDAFADAVVTLVKNALSPVLERIAAIEARQAVLGDVRDRLVVVETKTAMPMTIPTYDPPVPVDLSPVLERVAATEARIAVIGDVRDRLVAVETRSSDRPIISEVPLVLGPLENRVSTLEFEEGLRAERHRVAIEELTKDAAALRERLAVAETRQFIPGPMGRDGQPGRDGKDGKDGTNGTDGVGYDDLAVEQVGERSFTIKAIRGLQIKELGTLTFAVQIYRGVYLDGKSYERGDCVTWAGSEWHCNDTTSSKPGEGSKAWTLKVKRGRDGKDGRDAMPPVVSIR